MASFRLILQTKNSIIYQSFPWGVFSNPNTYMHLTAHAISPSLVFKSLFYVPDWILLYSKK
jgi:hypothetical protein